MGDQAPWRYNLHTASSVRLARAKIAFTEHLNIFNAMILSRGNTERVGATLFMEHVTLRD